MCPFQQQSWLIEIIHEVPLTRRCDLVGSKYSLKSFPKRLLLGFRRVCAFPMNYSQNMLINSNQMIRGLDWYRVVVCPTINVDFSFGVRFMFEGNFTWTKEEPSSAARQHKYLRTIFAVSVFPAPDSPEIMMDWFLRNVKRAIHIQDLCLVWSRVICL